MIRLMLMIAGWMLVCGPATADDDSCDEETALDTMAVSAVIAASLWNETVVPPDLIHPEGCFVWQQPGVALTITNIWMPGENHGMYFSPDKLYDLMLTMPDYRFGNTFIHPPEPDNVDSYWIRPRVQLLSADESHERLGKYLEGLEYWAELNPGMEMIIPTLEIFQTDSALVYIDSGGPVEFHFQRDKRGNLRLRHILIWDFFSA